MIEQHKLLTWVAAEIDAGCIRMTVRQVLSPIDAANLREAHCLIETGRAKGIIVIERFLRDVGNETRSRHIRAASFVRTAGAFFSRVSRRRYIYAVANE